MKEKRDLAVSDTDMQQQPTAPKVAQPEDKIMKTMMQFFADELLPLFNILGKVVSYAPTENVSLIVEKGLQDFNLVMEDGSWKHFEFQSSNKGLADLKRFHAYEAVAGHQHGVSITTYVLFSGNVRKPMYEYTDGINTYRVVPITMTSYHADTMLAELQEKVEQGETISKRDLIVMALCPLMSGKMLQKERICTALRILRKVTGYENEVRQIEAVLYIFAQKFLNDSERNEIKGEFTMLSFVQEWIDEGISRGISQGIKGMIEYAQELGQSFTSVRNKLIEKYAVSDAQADAYMKQYWK